MICYLLLAICSRLTFYGLTISLLATHEMLAISFSFFLVTPYVSLRAQPVDNHELGLFFLNPREGKLGLKTLGLGLKSSGLGLGAQGIQI